MGNQSNIGVSKIAAYAEAPDDFIRAGGKAYNAKATAYGTKAHQSIGRGPNKIAFVIGSALLIAALFYLGVLTL